jgi:tRNA(Ser,Leu) C12 N-acetylase TAN1
MCSISGKKMDGMHKIKTIEEAINTLKERDSTCAYSEFFKIRCYLKGTAHFEFLDEDLWNVFNIEACGAKKWLCE